MSPFQVWHAVQLAAHADRGKRPRAADVEKLLSELGWREFSYHLMHRYPDIATRNIDRYEATAEVVMRKGPIPRDNLRAFDARAIVSTIGPTVVMPK